MFTIVIPTIKKKRMKPNPDSLPDFNYNMYSYITPNGRMQKISLKITLLLAVLFLPLLLVTTQEVNAQQRNLPQSQLFRMGEGVVRIADERQLADSVNVWGDISNSGRYIVPRGTTVPDLLSYARGPVSLRSGDIILDWSEVRLEIAISRFNEETGREEAFRFVYRYNEPIPDELRDFAIRNNDLVSLRVLRRPTFRDYINVIAPSVSLLISTLVLWDRLSN